MIIFIQLCIATFFKFIFWGGGWICFHYLLYVKHLICEIKIKLHGYDISNYVSLIRLNIEYGFKITSQVNIITIGTHGVRYMCNVCMRIFLKILFDRWLYIMYIFYIKPTKSTFPFRIYLGTKSSISKVNLCFSNALSYHS